MSDREISWGDEEEEIISVPVAVPEKKEKAPLPVPEWSVDTRADLPIEKALNSSAPSWPEQEDNNASYNSGSNYNSNASYNDNGSSSKNNRYGSSYNGGYEASSSGAPQWDQSPLTRRPGRGPSRGEPVRETREFREPRGEREPRGPRESRERREPREPREPRGNGLNRYDDLGTVNLPGVDLSKMPQATTRLSFSNGDSNRREERESFRKNRDSRDVSERVDRITKEIDELSWGDNTTESEPVRAEPIRQYAPAPVAEPIKIINTTGRLEDDGWGDEPEESVLAPEPVCTKVPEQPAVRVTETVVTKPVEAPVAAVPLNSSVVASAPVPTTHVHSQVVPPAQQTQPQLQSPPPHQYMMPAAFPYMMNPMSPVAGGQMPIPAPMSCMPGMMMPIWVTCPFCYHCYMYPPVAPGSGPAPGATIQQTQQN